MTDINNVRVNQDAYAPPDESEKEPETELFGMDEFYEGCTRDEKIRSISDIRMMIENLQETIKA